MTATGEVVQLRRQVDDLTRRVATLGTKLRRGERVRDELAERLLLQPTEHVAYLAGKAQIERGHNPGFNTTAALVLTVGRLAGVSDEVLTGAPDKGPVTSEEGEPE